MGEDRQELLWAVVKGKRWIDKFNAREYDSAFAAYGEQYAAIYQQAVAEYGPQQLAQELYQALETFWQGERRRKDAILDCKMVITLYLTPMLLAMGGEAAAFAAALRHTWKNNRPKEGYEMRTKEEISKGFGMNLFGFPLRRDDGSKGFPLFWK